MCYIMSLNASVVVNRQAWTWQWTTAIRTLGTSPYTTHVHPATRLLQIEQGNTRLPSHLQVECFHKLQLPIEAHHGMYVHEHRFTTANYVQTHLNFSCFQVLFSGPDLATSVYLFHAHTYVLYVLAYTYNIYDCPYLSPLMYDTGPCVCTKMYIKVVDTLLTFLY